MENFIWIGDYENIDLLTEWLHEFSFPSVIILISAISYIVVLIIFTVVQIAFCYSSWFLDLGPLHFCLLSSIFYIMDLGTFLDRKKAKKIWITCSINWYPKFLIFLKFLSLLHASLSLYLILQLNPFISVFLKFLHFSRYLVMWFNTFIFISFIFLGPITQ